MPRPQISDLFTHQLRGRHYFQGNLLRPKNGKTSSNAIGIGENQVTTYGCASMETDRQSAVELDDALFLFPFLFDPYSNTGTPEHRSTSIRKEYHDPDNHQRNSGSPEVRQHRHRGTGTTNPQFLQKADCTASFNHRARSPKNAFLLATNPQIFGEAGPFAADKLLFQTSPF